MRGRGQAPLCAAAAACPGSPKNLHISCNHPLRERSHGARFALLRELAEYMVCAGADREGSGIGIRLGLREYLIP